MRRRQHYLDDWLVLVHVVNASSDPPTPQRCHARMRAHTHTCCPCPCWASAGKEAERALLRAAAAASCCNPCVQDVCVSAIRQGLQGCTARRACPKAAKASLGPPPPYFLPPFAFHAHAGATYLLRRVAVGIVLLLLR